MKTPLLQFYAYFLRYLLLVYAGCWRLVVSNAHHERGDFRARTQVDASEDAPERDEI